MKTTIKKLLFLNTLALLVIPFTKLSAQTPYARLEMENTRVYMYGSDTGYVYQDVYVRLYTDSNCTTRLTLSGGWPVPILYKRAQITSDMANTTFYGEYDEYYSGGVADGESEALLYGNFPVTETHPWEGNNGIVYHNYFSISDPDWPWQYIPRPTYTP